MLFSYVSLAFVHNVSTWAKVYSIDVNFTSLDSVRTLPWATPLGPNFFSFPLKIIGGVCGTENSLLFSNICHFASYLDKLCASWVSDG